MPHPCHALTMPLLSRPRHGQSMASVNHTRPHCVYQMGKTHSKPLAPRNGRGAAWARHAMCESAFRNSPLSPQSSQYKRQKILTRKKVCCWLRPVNKPYTFFHSKTPRSSTADIFVSSHYYSTSEKGNKEKDNKVLLFSTANLYYQVQRKR